MKKIISAAVAAIMLGVMCAPSALAAESWREAFVTRLMRIMSSNPSYNEIVLTDLDRNGIPEAFVMRGGADGGISAGFTMNGNTISSIEVPGDIIGECLTDITVYEKDGRYIFVGREIPRYSSVINYYKLVFDGQTLTAEKILKSYVSAYPTIPYVDMYGDDFLTNGYPDRSKIKSFVDQYEGINSLTATNSNAKLLVDGEEVEISGYTVNDSNYYKIRDIAMILRNTNAKFDVAWDEDLSAITVSRGVKYTIVGGELSEDSATALNVEQNTAPVYVDGEETELFSYNINGNTYFKIRDIGDMVGFEVDWDGDAQAVVIKTE
ncbi:MAG: copper amine oxidase N-terminal domain-containing protein [Firmicutes bacterium]|nr:copper amine oxidase N-terminal domain-containing protein [Bacillota bacterium]